MPLIPIILFIILTAMGTQDVNDFGFGSNLVEVSILESGVEAICQAPFPSTDEPPYDITVTWSYGECTETQFIGMCVGAVGQWTAKTTWASRWLYIEFKQKAWRITTADCIAALKIEDGTQRGLFILEKIEQIDHIPSE